YWPHGRSGVAAVAALAAHVGKDLEVIDVDPGDGVDGVDERDAVGAGVERGVGGRHDVGDVGRELDDDRDAGGAGNPARDHLAVLGHLPHGGAHAALAHAVRAAVVELDAVGARVLDLLHHGLPGLLVAGD